MAALSARWRVPAAIALVLIAVVVALYLLRGEIALRLTERMAQRGLSADLTAELPDGLHAAVCGSGSPLTDPSRAGPCLAVVAGQRVFVVDAGEGSAEVLSGMGLAPGKIERLFLTHFHSDHIDGLGAMALQRWAGGAARTPLPVHGPPGVERVTTGFNEAYALDSTYRVGHHGPKIVPPEGFGLAAQPFAMPGRGGAVVYDQGGVRVTAFPVDHDPARPAVGYRFDYRGRSLVISGDTQAIAETARQARGTDLLVHEALSPELTKILEDAARRAGRDNVAQVMADIPDYHATPEEAAKLAVETKARALLLTHMVPPLRLRALEEPFLGGARRVYDGPLWVARDGDVVSLPAGGTQVRLSRR